MKLDTVLKKLNPVLKKLNTVLEVMKRKWKLTVPVSLIIISVGFIGWYLLGSKNSVTVEATTARVRKGTIRVTVSGTGSVKPSLVRNITANVSGIITSINFKNGQRVKKGDLLFELNNDSIRTDVKKSELDLLQAELDYSEKLEESKQQNVTAPISGQVSGIVIDQGQDMQKSAVLMVINDTSMLVFKVPVHGGQINQIQPGQKADVTVLDLMAPLQGRVQKVDRGGIAGSDGSKMYYITVVIPNPGALSPGQHAQAIIYTSNGLEPGYEAGTLAWAQTVTVKAGVSGTITQLYVDENAYVKKGQKLAYIAGDSVNTELISQKLRLEQAGLSLNESQKKLADCKICAPVDGIINLEEAQATSQTGSSNSNSSGTESSGEDYSQVGDQVSSNQVLATIMGAAGMSVTVPVDEVDIAKIKSGQKATVTADALPDRTFNGTVSDIAAKGTEQSGVATFDVTVSIDQPEGLKENMTANVEILVAKKDDVLFLPVEAVQERQGRKFVLVPTSQDNSQSSGNTGGAGGDSRSSGSGTTGGSGNRPVGTVEVETGLYNESIIEITSGLKEGDIVTIPNVTRSTSTTGRPNTGNTGGMPFLNPAGGTGRTGTVIRSGEFGGRSR